MFAIRETTSYLTLQIRVDKEKRKMNTGENGYLIREVRLLNDRTTLVSNSYKIAIILKVLFRSIKSRVLQHLQQTSTEIKPYSFCENWFFVQSIFFCPYIFSWHSWACMCVVKFPTSHCREERKKKEKPKFCRHTWLTKRLDTSTISWSKVLSSLHNQTVNLSKWLTL